MFDGLQRVLRQAWQWHFSTRRRKARSFGATAFGIENLEDRQLLSASHKGTSTDPQLASIQVEERIAKILNGTPTSGFPSVGLIGDSDRDDCSGTLIAPQWVLTAAHCSTGVGDTDGRFTIGGQTYSTEEIFIHPNYRPRRFNSNKANDIALWKLSDPVVGITPSPINRETPQVGTLLTLVGFGSGGDLNGETGDFGTKRVGTTPLEKVTNTRIRWVFNEPTDSNTGHGDSGGPAFIQRDGTYYVAGVTSGGTKFDARQGDHSFDTRVDAFQTWIDAVMNGEFDQSNSQARKSARRQNSAAANKHSCGCNDDM